MKSTQRVSIDDIGNEDSNSDPSEDYSSKYLLTLVDLKAEELQQTFNNF
jgi:hypothetical protein